MKKFILFVFIIFSLTSSLCKASEVQEEEKVASKKSLNLIEIVELALKNNPQTRQAWLNTEISNAQYKQQLADYYPVISATGTYSATEKDYKESGVENTSTESITPKLSLTYLLFDFGAREASVKDFKYRLKSVKYDENDTIQNLIYSVINAYYDLFSAIATEQSEKETESSRLVAFKAASLRYKLGLVPLTDKLQSETAYAQSQLARQKAENDVEIKKAELNFLLNLNPNEEIFLKVPDLKINEQPLENNIENLMETALKNRPDLASKKMSQKASAESLKKAKRDRYPSISLDSSYSEVDDLKSTNTDYSNSTIGITATIPIFKGGYIKNNIAKTKREMQLRNSEIEALEKNIKLDVWETYQNFKTAKLTYITSKKLLKSASESEKTTLGMYKNGKASILDLLNAQSDLANAKKEIISSQHEWFVAKANLARAIGYSNLENIKKPMNNNFGIIENEKN